MVVSRENLRIILSKPSPPAPLGLIEIGISEASHPSISCSGERALPLATLPQKRLVVFGAPTCDGITLAVSRAKSKACHLRPLSHPVVRHDENRRDLLRERDGLDNVLVFNDRWFGDATNLYANGHALKDPVPSPTYGDCMARNKSI